MAATRASRRSRIWRTRVGCHALRLTARAASQMRGDIPLVLLDIVWRSPPTPSPGAAAVRLLGAGDVTGTSFRVFLPVACMVQVFATLACGAYGRTWRHASIDEARRLLAAGADRCIVLLLALFGWSDDPVPLSVLVAGPRCSRRSSSGWSASSRGCSPFRRSGTCQGTGLPRRGRGLRQRGRRGRAGDAVEPTPRAAARRGLVDDDRSLRRRTIHGVPVAGDVDRLVDVIDEYRVDQLLLADPRRATATWRAGRRRRRHRRRARAGAAHVGVVGARHAAAAATSASLDIEDLLRRDAGQHRPGAVRRAAHRQAGARHRRRRLDRVRDRPPGRRRSIPASLVLLDHDETHLHDAIAATIDGAAELALGRHPRRARSSMRSFADATPEVVFHAAAHKHVPILEDFACEAHPHQRVRLR